MCIEEEPDLPSNPNATTMAQTAANWPQSRRIMEFCEKNPHRQMAAPSRVLDVLALRTGSNAELLNKEFASIPLCAATEVDLGSTREERQLARAKCRCKCCGP